MRRRERERRRRRVAWRIAALAVLLAVSPVGCAGTGEDPQVATAGGAVTATDEPAADGPADEPADDDERMRQFAGCMRENGVDMPDPEPGGPVRIGPGATGADQETMRAAMDACRSLLPNGGEPPKLSPEDLEKARAMAACMREHGVDMPDPDPDGGGGIRIRPGPGGEQPDRELVEQALDACRHLGPQRGTGQRGGDG